MSAAPWRPTVPSDGSLEDVALSEWVGQALGAASSCWANLAGAGEFDSVRCAGIYTALMAHINAVIAGTTKAAAVRAGVHGFAPLTFTGPDGQPRTTDWCGAPSGAAGRVYDEVCGALPGAGVHQVGPDYAAGGEVPAGDGDEGEQVLVESSRPVTGRATMHTVDVEQMPEQ